MSHLITSDNVLTAVKTVSIASMDISTGAGLSFLAIILPALRSVSSIMAATIWGKMSPASKNIQISAILMSVLGGTSIYNRNQTRAYIYSAILMASVLPYTAVNFFPINEALLKMVATGVDDGTIAKRMNQWYTRQFGRVLLNFAAFVISLYAALHGDGGVVKDI